MGHWTAEGINPERALILLEKLKRVFARIADLNRKENREYRVDVRDLLIFGGMFSIGYGLWSLYPWLGFTVFGFVSMALGLGWLFRIPRK
ncbi:MAG: hypothetical protein ABFD62_10775 [Syntrophaceae bacterium]